MQQTLDEIIKEETKVEPLVTNVKIKKDLNASDANEDEKMFKCEHEGCTSSFKSRSSLKDHQKVHSDER